MRGVRFAGLSVVVAALIGRIELGGPLARKLDAHRASWSWIEHIDINALGFIVVGRFAATWILAATVWPVWPVWPVWHIEDRRTGRRLNNDPA